MSLRSLQILGILPILVSCGSRSAGGGASPPTEPSRAVDTFREYQRDATIEYSGPAHRRVQSKEKNVAEEKVLANTVWNTLEIEPEIATSTFNRLPHGSVERLRLIRHYAMRAAEENPEEALGWALALEDEAERSAACERVALVLANSDPQRAAQLLSESCVASRAHDVAVVEVLQRWANQSPTDAAAWIVLFPAGAVREAGLDAVVSRWLAMDAAAVFEWVATIDNEAVRTETTQVIATALHKLPADKQTDWLKLANPTMRAEISRLP